MQVLSRQTLIFRVEGHKDFVLRPSAHPVVAPDHIRATPLFKLAATDGTIKEFVPAVPVDDEKVKAEAAAKAAADADAKAKAEADAQAEADKAAADAKAKADAEVKDKKAK